MAKEYILKLINKPKGIPSDDYYIPVVSQNILQLGGENPEIERINCEDEFLIRFEMQKPMNKDLENHLKTFYAIFEKRV